MLINISTSKANHDVVTQLTKKLTGGTKENVIARIALGYSLSTGSVLLHKSSIFTILRVRSIRNIYYSMRNSKIFTLH